MSFALRVLVAALILGGSLGVSQMRAQPSSPNAPTPPGAVTQSDTVDLSATGNVKVDNRTGSITVTTWDRPQVGYEVTLAPSEGRSTVATNIDVDRSAEELSLGHEHSWSITIPGLLTISPDGTSEPVGHFRVVMPNTASLEIDDFGSTIEVSGVTGDVEIDTHKGAVTARGVEGPLELETFSSPAEVTGLRKSADLETHSGRITAAFEQFSAASSVESGPGTLRLYLPATTGFALEMDADSSQVVIDEAFGPPSKDDERWVFNGGGPELSAETSSGTIELRPLDARSGSFR